MSRSFYSHIIYVFFGAKLQHDRVRMPRFTAKHFCSLAKERGQLRAALLDRTTDEA